MRAWRGVLAFASIAGIAAAAVMLDQSEARRDRADAERLLRSVLHSGTLSAIQARATVGVLTGGSYEERQATLRSYGRTSRLTVTGGDTVVDEGERVWRLDAQAETATALGASERGVDWDLLTRNYTVTSAGTDTVSAHEARGVRVVRKATGKTAVEMWVEPGSHLILQRRTWDAEGHLVASRELADIREIRGDPAVGVPDGWQMEDPEDAATAVTLDEFVQGADFTPQQPTYVPEGFREAGLYSLVCPNGRAYAELRYSDGLRVLVIHEHRPRQDGQGLGLGRGGGRGQGRGQGRGRRVDHEPVLIDQGQAKTVRYRREDLRIVVTGDLTAEEIVKVVESIPPIPEA